MCHPRRGVCSFAASIFPPKARSLHPLPLFPSCTIHALVRSLRKRTCFHPNRSSARVPTPNFYSHFFSQRFFHRKSTVSSIKDREDELYDFYGSMKEPSSVLKPILADHANARLLRCAAQRQVFVILRRSEKYEDGQVSIYDKVLVKLWVNEQTLQSMGLLSLFVREYLGGKIAKTAEEETAIVSGCIAAMEIVENALKRPPTPPAPFDSSDDDMLSL